MKRNEQSCKLYLQRTTKTVKPEMKPNKAFDSQAKRLPNTESSKNELCLIHTNEGAAPLNGTPQGKAPYTAGGDVHEVCPLEIAG